MTEPTKQAVTGFKVEDVHIKKKKESEIVKIILSADVSSMGAGEHDIGDILKALHEHMTGDVDVGLSVFMNEKE